MEKFNLSERMIGYTYEAKQDVFFLEDVKEFIKRLKEIKFEDYDPKYIRNLIDKLAGDKLK